MNFVNFPKIRIEQYPQGWVVEIQKRKWYGLKYWTHIISVSGMPNRPWYFNSFDHAITEAKLYLSNDLLRNSHIYSLADFVKHNGK